MRTIKFRAKSLIDGGWRYGSLIYTDQQTVAIKTADVWGFVNPDTVGQFTGLHDINGAEIYEGDVIDGKEIYEGEIIEGRQFRHYVKYDESRAAFMPYYIHEFSGETNDTDEWIDIYNMRVIGNIHDNPELSNSK